MKQIEVEVRGPLTREEHKKLRSFLQKEGKYLGKRNQLVIFFANEAFDLSLKKDERNERIVLKLGDWHKASRDEFEVVLRPGEFGRALDVFKNIGFDKGYHAPSCREDFEYEGVKFSLKTKALIGDHFEMELMADEKHSVPALKKKLVDMAQSLNLRLWEEEAYRKHVKGSYPPEPQEL